MKSWNEMSFSSRVSNTDGCAYRSDFDLFGALINHTINERSRVSLDRGATPLGAKMNVDGVERIAGLGLPGGNKGLS